MKIFSFEQQSHKLMHYENCIVIQVNLTPQPMPFPQPIPYPNKKWCLHLPHLAILNLMPRSVKHMLTWIEYCVMHPYRWHSSHLYSEPCRVFFHKGEWNPGKNTNPYFVTLLFNVPGRVSASQWANLLQSSISSWCFQFLVAQSPQSGEVIFSLPKPTGTSQLASRSLWHWQPFFPHKTTGFFIGSAFPPSSLATSSQFFQQAPLLSTPKTLWLLGFSS